MSGRWAPQALMGDEGTLEVDAGGLSSGGELSERSRRRRATRRPRRSHAHEAARVVGVAAGVP